MIKIKNNKKETSDGTDNFDFEMLLHAFRGEFVNGGGYVKADVFNDDTDPYDVFEWFKQRILNGC